MHLVSGLSAYNDAAFRKLEPTSPPLFHSLLMSQPITDGIYRIDKSGEEYLGSACLSLGFGGSTRIVTMREGDVFEEDHLKWELKYDSAREAYTIQNVSNKLYLSFEGAPETNTELYAGPEASHFEFRPSETTPGRFK
ncbi:hypothetical protein FRC12_002431 [Ceratobasidium sp. 428]|nr:hypothetical protein FRC12_002431 [Ceratobasidium sp. 428]